MIRHIVLFRFKPSVGQSDYKQLCKALESIQRHCVGVLDFHAGNAIEQFPHLTCGFNWGFTMDFRSREDLENYNIHPEHLRIVEIIRPLLVGELRENALVFDYDL